MTANIGDKLRRTWRQPWRGESYGTCSSGRRTLVMGESHYGEGHEVDDPDFTRKVLGKVAAGKKRLRFYTIAARVLTGERDIDVSNFWQTVAFANYCQSGAWSRSEGARSDMWTAGDAALARLIADLQPTHIILCSGRAWNRMLRNAVLTERQPIEHDGHACKTGLLKPEASSGQGVALLSIWHPARLSFGQPIWWHQFVASFWARATTWR